jgi:trehalose 6-phosphate synthase
VPLVAYANRLPVLRGRQGWRLSAGGLVSALRPALESRGGAWVGWDGGADDIPRRVEGLDVELLPVALSRREVDDYYHGFANRTLWPLLHGLIEQPVFERRWWRAYRDVNERFAAVESGGRGMRWVHDYHLMLLPSLLRRAHAGPIEFFLHVPFPPPEVYARLPWREQVLDGLLGADRVSFHTETYRDNFVRTCARLRENVRVEGRTIALAHRRVRTAAHPISIDASALAKDARSSATERSLRGLRAQFGERIILLGVDRLDYTKGIIERLRAIELLLEERVGCVNSVTPICREILLRGSRPTEPRSPAIDRPRDQVPSTIPAGSNAMKATKSPPLRGKETRFTVATSERWWRA